MNYSKLNQKQILFLYAYLRQMDRSLDKSRWTSVKELNDYYKDRITPEQVINYLQINFNIAKEDLNITSVSPSAMTFRDKFRMFFQRNHLSTEKITNIYNLLLSFDRHLKSDSPYTTETEVLRIDIARFYSKVLGPKISVRNLKKLSFTEYYMQNKVVKAFELKRLVPKDFY
ncbi:hypothetical protein QFZ37_002025 [Chryseobacterium ginsenosidimutans]|uniref:hypothetical protein n=1 Tax=Chryseobacterium ginsenosidimutans TaxID=687846 RepID=UPI002785988A|nr:hypothetical protein [Chryseobacterium ginsenosidimutans]MDQ0593656.1 hypothetical protein [Chryseobacterium ginsenosidimutans]